jgi:hypothetical protein
MDVGAEELAAAFRELRYDWRALARLREDYGADWPKEVERVLTDPDTTTLAVVLCCGFPASDERADAAWWMDRSPPISITQVALERAVTLAIHGPPSVKDELQGERQPPPRLTWWRRLFGLGVELEGRPANSGA